MFIIKSAHIMRKNILLIITLLFFSSVNVFAQTGEFEFEEENHDFGLVEEGVQAAHEFKFKNTGSVPIVITNVRASCGCTTPNWTKDPVPPGGTGVITASYNSQGRPGNFNKSITITSNAAETTKTLYIKGIVQKPQPKPEYRADELKKSAEAKIDKEAHNFGKVERTQKVSKEFTIKNTGKTPLTISKVQAACNCISHTLEGDAVQPGKSAKLTLTYNPFNEGINKDIVNIFTNDLNKEYFTITLSAEVVSSLNTQSPVKQENAVPFK